MEQLKKAVAGRTDLHGQVFLRRRKFLLVLPILVLPFITFIFWVFGGGKVTDVQGQQVQDGINMQLPGVQLKEGSPLNKLSYYEKADSDSAKFRKQMAEDPNYVYPGRNDTIFPDTSSDEQNLNDPFGKQDRRQYSDPNEEKVYKKLAQLNTAMNTDPLEKEYEERIYDNQTNRNTALNSSEVNRLEQMMQGLNRGSFDDPEMQQLNSTLQTILDIQHPERVQEKLKQASAEKKGTVYPVVVKQGNSSMSLIENHLPDTSKTATSIFPTKQENIGFYDLGNDASLSDQNTVEGVVHETQTIVNGSIVKLRLLNDIYVNGKLVPKNTLVFGQAALSGERLEVAVSSIRFQNALYPVDLAVYDMDGLPGVHIPGAISRDAAKQTADGGVQSMGITNLNPSIGAQAASAGIEAAKTILSRKVKLIRVTVKAGYKVLLHDEKQKD